MELSMTQDIDTLLSNYEQGLLSRRQLLQALALAVPLQQQTPRSVLHGLQLDHVNVQVSDAKRSADFYGRLFGVPRDLNGRWQVDLPNGSSISLMPATDRTNRPGTVDHFCIGVELSPQETTSKLKEAGIELVAFPDQRGGSYVRDPDGFLVQILTVKK
jgi:catechol 2,3-dioxygenase-like lactoylglutathione lyase family enzyme